MSVPRTAINRPVTMFMISAVIVLLGGISLFRLPVGGRVWAGVAFATTGLALIAFGTGCLKPNVSVLVGSLYTPGDARRDAGFSIF